MTSQKLPERKLPEGWAQEVLHFWFDELNEQDWFSGSAHVDEKCSTRFRALYAALKDHPSELDDADASTLLAAVIVLDQFPRNIFRNTPEAYATDGKALALARHAVASGKDKSLSKAQRHFLYMPFMHSEDLTAQAESVRLFAELGTPENMKYAHHHHDVVERFGRFPHRNAIFGRRSRPEELEFLKTEPPLV
jgi:uncharacterized protein (DUF924 family)